MICCPHCEARYVSTDACCPQCRWAPPLIDGFIAWAPDPAAGGSGLSDQSFALIARYEDRHFWFRARNAVIVSALRRHFPALRTLLEVGCGTGVVLAAIRAAFPHVQLTGTELSAGGLRVAAGRVADVRMMQMDARRIPYESEFDVIGAFDVLEHVEDDEAVLAGMRRGLTRGGGIVVSVPQHPWLWSGIDDYSHHFRRYTRSDLVAKIRVAGFTIEHVTSFMTLVLPAMLLSRLATRDAASLDPAAELKIGSLTNAVCGALCACERWPVAGGWSLPVGGSLLAIARKAE